MSICVILRLNSYSCLHNSWKFVVSVLLGVLICEHEAGRLDGTEAGTTCCQLVKTTLLRSMLAACDTYVYLLLYFLLEETPG